MTVRRRATAKEFFEAIARRYDRVYALSGATSRERMARVLRALAGKKRVLVLGIGTGRELPALLDAGHEVVGLDVSPAMVAECNKRSRTVPIVVGDFYEPLPFADASFDAAIALHGTLTHPPAEATESLASLAKELARVLAHEGVLVAEVPAAEALARITAARDGMHVAEAGRDAFVHHDDTAQLDLEGVALAEEAWAAILAPWFTTEIEPLGTAEHLVVAARVVTFAP